MKAFLMHRDRDFELERELPRHERTLTQDLELDTLLLAMAGDDPFLLGVARKALLLGPENELEAILHRQAILKDCVKNPAVVRELYGITVEAMEARRKHYFGIFSTRHPSGVLYEASELLQMFLGMLRKLRDIAAAQAAQFESPGFNALFTTLVTELSDAYLAHIEEHLKELKFRHGVLISAELGDGNEGTNYGLRKPRGKQQNWLERLLGKGPPGHTFHIDERDEAGARAVSEMRDQGINLVANALGQSADHVLGFFQMLRAELAFYVGCLNLHEKLASIGASISFPRPEAPGSRLHRCSGLYDVCLALSMGRSVVGNALAADGKNLVIITGANQGGKSTFLRGLGLAQLMMQCGMFVGAESFAGELCAGIFTHYKREEDATMKSGKLDEELGRMSEIADAILPNSMLLFNESFASTNEREGSEIARQIVCALEERRIKVVFVTHLYEFAHGLLDQKRDRAVFLRAERLADGTRSFKLVDGEPLQTSFGEDLYREVFAPSR